MALKESSGELELVGVLQPLQMRAALGLDYRHHIAHGVAAFARGEIGWMARTRKTDAAAMAGLRVTW